MKFISDWIDSKVSDFVKKVIAIVDADEINWTGDYTGKLGENIFIGLDWLCSDYHVFVGEVGWGNVVSMNWAEERRWKQALKRYGERRSKEDAIERAAEKKAMKELMDDFVKNG